MADSTEEYRKIYAVRVSYEVRQKCFIAHCGFYDKEIPRAAGFRWDKENRSWKTDDFRVAKKLIGYADERAKELIESKIQEGA